MFSAVGLSLDYVETNSAWFRDEDSALALVTGLKEKGLNSLLVSISPFHNRHIPLARVKGVMAACRRAGVGVFPWIPDFYDELEALGDERPHAPEEFAAAYGRDYWTRIPQRYWIHLGGRAASTFARIFPLEPLSLILSRNRGGCRELVDVSHFHVDLDGRYIPGLCAGLGLKIEDIGGPLTPEKYPLFNLLCQSGVGGLLEMARKDFGFEPAASYLNKCGLCLDIRRALLPGWTASEELHPAEFYGELD